MIQKIARYEIRRLLGEGGAAKVYLGWDPRFKRQVAIKMLSNNLHDWPELQEQFEQEVRIISALEDVNVVPVYDFGEEEGFPFLVMRQLSGGSLSDRLAKGRLPLTQIDRILKVLATTLDRVHRKHIIHRDLKPENILFDSNGIPFISDFGLAKFSEYAGTLTGTQTSVLGTPAYISPEQAEGLAEQDHRCDLYSLGVLLFHMITGNPPFVSETPWGYIQQHIHQTPPRLKDLKIDAPAGLQEILDRALAKRPDDRYQTAQELSAAFHAVLPSEEAREAVAPTMADTRTETDQPTMVEIRPELIPPSDRRTRQTVSAPPTPRPIRSATPPRRGGWILIAALFSCLGLFSGVGGTVAYQRWGAERLPIPFLIGTPTIRATYTPFQTKTPLQTPTEDIAILPMETDAEDPQAPVMRMPLLGSYLTENTKAPHGLQAVISSNDTLYVVWMDNLAAYRGSLSSQIRNPAGTWTSVLSATTGDERISGNEYQLTASPISNVAFLFYQRDDEYGYRTSEGTSWYKFAGLDSYGNPTDFYQAFAPGGKRFSFGYFRTGKISAPASRLNNVPLSTDFLDNYDDSQRDGTFLVDSENGLHLFWSTNNALEHRYSSYNIVDTARSWKMVSMSRSSEYAAFVDHTGSACLVRRDGYTFTIARYDPDTSSWIPFPLPNTPYPMSDVAAWKVVAQPGRSASYLFILDSNSILHVAKIGNDNWDWTSTSYAPSPPVNASEFALAMDSKGVLHMVWISDNPSVLATVTVPNLP